MCMHRKDECAVVFKICNFLYDKQLKFKQIIFILKAPIIFGKQYLTKNRFKHGKNA